MSRLLALLLLLPGCIVIEDDGDDDPPEVRLDDICGGAPAYVEAASSDRDYLVLDVSYGGCSDDATVFACWDGYTLDSLPPQVNIQVRQTGAGDSDALQRATAVFDLAPVVDAVGRGGPIVVHAGEQTTEWGPWAY